MSPSYACSKLGLFPSSGNIICQNVRDCRLMMESGVMGRIQAAVVYDVESWSLLIPNVGSMIVSLPGLVQRAKFRSETMLSRLI